MVLAALRRLAFVTVGAMAATAAFSLLLGAVIGASVDRAVSLGFYCVGCFLMVAGFFVGNRGPARVKSETPGGGLVPFAWFGNRTMRWATLPELNEAINVSAIFVGVGLIMVVVGVLIDSRYHVV